MLFATSCHVFSIFFRLFLDLLGSSSLFLLHLGFSSLIVALLVYLCLPCSSSESRWFLLIFLSLLTILVSPSCFFLALLGSTTFLCSCLILHFLASYWLLSNSGNLSGTNNQLYWTVWELRFEGIQSFANWRNLFFFKLSQTTILLIFCSLSSAFLYPYNIRIKNRN